MQFRLIHWLSALLALSTLLLLVVSGFMVSASTGLPIPAWAEGGQMAHRILAGVVAILSLAALAACWRAKRWGWLMRLSLPIVLVVAAQAGIGMSLARKGATPSASVLQAMLTHALLTLGAVLFFISSRSFAKEAETVEDELQPPLRSIAWWPAIFVVAQILLGSAYRHGMMGVMPHLSLAFVTAGALAFLAILVATTYPTHRPLKRVAFTVVWFILAQIVLGLIALFYRVQAASADAANAPAAWLALFTVSHVVLGSFTLAATVWMAIEIRKYVRPGLPAALDSRGQADATAKLETGLN